MVERQESENEIRLKTIREAAQAGTTDTASGRFRTFEGADALEERLSVLSKGRLRPFYRMPTRQ